MNPFNLSGTEFLGLFAGLFVVAFIATRLLRRMLRVPNDETSFDLERLSPYQVAYLSGGSKSVLAAALARLVHEGAVDINGSTGEITATGFGDKQHDPVEEIAMVSVGSVANLRVKDWEPDESIFEIRSGLEDLGRKHRQTTRDV